MHGPSPWDRYRRPRQKPGASRGVDQFLFGCGNAGRRVAELGVAEEMPGQACDIVEGRGRTATCSTSTSTRPFGSPALVTIRSAVFRVLHRGPRHEFEIRGEAVRRRGTAEFGERVRQAPFVRIVAGDQNGSCLQPASGFEKGGEGRDQDPTRSRSGDTPRSRQSGSCHQRTRPPAKVNRRRK